MVRVFKTAWFAKAADKARISDDDLCEAILQVMAGQADHLGGGVFKKRLDKNRHRSILVTFSGGSWIYEYLFAKKDRANISEDELAGFRRLAKTYSTMTTEQLASLIMQRDLMEICHGQEE